MKKLLQKFLLVFCLVLAGGAAMAQTAPVITYNSGTNAITFTDGTAGSFSPNTSAGGTVPTLQYGLVTTPYGSTASPSVTGTTNATGTAARFNSPYSVVGDGAGNLYVADYYNNEIRKIVISTGAVTLFAGSTAGTAGYTNGVGTAAKFSAPAGICIDASATNLYVSDYGGATGDVRKIVISTATVSTLASNAAYGFGGLTVDASGLNLYVADPYASVIRKILISSGAVTTYAGSGTIGLVNSATLTSARFSTPSDVAFDASGNLYVADYGNNVIRKITSAGVTTFAGTGTAGATNGTGTTGVTFNAPFGLQIDPGGNMYVSDGGNYLIRKIVLSTAAVSTLAGTGTSGQVNGTSLTTSSFGALGHPWIDANGSMYVPDRTYNNIRQLNICGYTIAGALPGGISFTYIYGNIYGNATVTGTFPVTVTAYNFYGSGSANVTITCNPAAPNISYTPSSYTFTTGVAGTTSAATNTGGAATFTFDASTPAPAYLSINSSTGVITSSTASVAAAAATYKIDATNVSGSSTPASVTITIIAPSPPIVSYTPSSYAFTVGTASTTSSITNTGGAATYSIDASTPLPAYLTFNATTGVISCSTAGVATAATNYKVDATNGSGTVIATVSITIYPISPTVSYAGSPYTFYNGAAITTQTPSTSNSPTSFTISPNLTTNTGLTFNTATGVISGTPMIIASATTYSISAYNANPTPGTTTISITIDGPPTISYTGSPYSYTVGTAITSLTPTVSNNPTSYSISPSITTNTGLTFSTSTGVISGTPTTASTPVTYTITATNPAGNGMAMISVQVYPKSPTIAYTGSPFTFGQNVAITSLTPMVTNAPTSYTISPNITTNTGLAFSTSTGVISGTPTIVSAAVTYTISAFNANPTAGTTPISVTVVAKASITYTTPNTYPVGTAIAALSPTNSGGAVPATKTFGTSTVILSGLNKPVGMAVDPSGNVYVVNYGSNTVTEYTTSNTTITFGSGANLSGPVGIVFDSSGNAYILNKTSGTIVKYTGGVYQGTIVNSGLAVPLSIAIDASNNIYVGNNNNSPANNSYITKYTTAGGAPILTFNTNSTVYPVSGGIAVDPSGNIYVADNDGGSYIDEYNSAGVFQNLNGVGNTNEAVYIDGAGNIYFTTAGGAAGSNTAAIYTAGFASNTANLSGFSTPEGIVTDGAGNLYVSDYTTGNVTKFVPTSGYTLNGTLPPGLAFSSTTGKITGTPTAAYSGTYTVMAYNAAGGVISNTFTITCTSPPIISYTSPVYYPTGTAIVPLAPTNTGSSATYTISPALPSGLVINPGTGIISGTPTALSAATTYTVTATNSYGTGTCIINITTYSAPVIAYTPSTNVYPVNAAITPLVPASTGGTIIADGYSTGTATTFATVASAWGITTDASGNIYVVSNSGKTTTEYSAAGLAGNVYTQNAKATGVAVSGGAVYVVLTNGRIYKYTAAGAGALFNSTLYNYDGTAGTGYGIAADAAGDLYVADYNDGIIWKYTASTGVMAQFNTGNNFYDPTAVAVDGAGNVYFIDTYNDDVVEYSSTGVYLNTIATGLSNPYSIYIDQYGYIYVGDSGLQTVTKYTSTGTVVTSISGTPGVNDPRGLVTDAAGNLYVSSYASGIVTKYPPILYAITIPSGKTLPPGIVFNTFTGTFSGTPTAAFAPVTYTITSNGINGTSGSTTVTLSCIVSYDWVGITSTDWNTTTNWKSNTVPGISNTANIGVNYTFNNQPTVGTGATNVNVGAINIGNSNGPVTLTVAATYSLILAGDITDLNQVNANNGYYNNTLAGSGTIKAVNLNVIGLSQSTSGLYTSVNSLQLSGNIALTSNYGTVNEPAVFGVTGGVTSLTGTGATGIISTTNQPGSSSAIYVFFGTLQWANATGLSGLSSLGFNTVNSVSGVIGYSGANQTVYTDLPITGLPGGVNYQGISFSGTGIKTPNGSATNNLNIAGSFANTLANDAGDNVSLTNTIVNFNGTTAQALAGGTASQNYGTIFNTVNFSNAGVKTMTGNFYVAPTGTLTLSSGAPLVTGDAVTTPTLADGSLTLLSNASGSAAIAPVTSGSISGNANVQRYVSGDRGYRLMSSPVYAGNTGGNNIYSVNYLLNKMYVTGSGTGFTATGNPTLFLYDEGFVPQYSTFYNSNFVAISSLAGGTGATPSYPLNTNGANITMNVNIPVGNGYYNFYRGNLSEGTANLTNSTYQALPDTITATGTLITGQVIVKDWYSPSSSYLGAVSQQLNLIGNPYASAIDLGTVATSTTSSGIYMTPYNGTTGVTKFIYELNPITNVYGQYITDGSLPSTNGASQYIASGQAFFVQAFGANAAQVIFNENGKATSTNATVPGLMVTRHVLAAQIPGTVNPLLRLKMSLDSVHNEESLITFDPASKAQYVFNEDAPHQTGQGKIGFSSTSGDNIKLAINSMPLLQTQTIPLNVYATNDGLYTIGMEQVHQLPSLYDVWLKDAYQKDSLDIKNNPTYSFNILHVDTNSFGTKRFTLVIRQDPALMVHLLSFTVNKVTPGDQVVWTTENEQNYTNFAVQRSTDGGKTFTLLDGLASTGQGTYTFLDKNPVIGSNSYRLQLTDLNGTITYSNIVTIMYANTGYQIAINGMMLYPNPTSGTVNLAIDQSTTTQATVSSAATTYNIQIINNLGSIIKTAVSSSPNWQTDVSTLIPGTYFIKVTNASTNGIVGKSAFVKL